jgi:hypothetical protein
MLKFAKYLKPKSNGDRDPEEVKKIVDDYIQKKREAGEKPDLSLLQRFLLGSTGLGMIRGNMHPVTSALRGNADLWHGSAPENLLMPDEYGNLTKGILNEGLSLEHAGKNKRINANMMKNSPMHLMDEFLQRQGKKLNPQDEKYIEGLISEITSPPVPHNYLNLDLMHQAVQASRDNPREIVSNLKASLGRDPLPEELNTLVDAMRKHYPEDGAHGLVRQGYITSTSNLDDLDKIKVVQDNLAKQKYRELGHPQGAWENLTRDARTKFSSGLVPDVLNHPLNSPLSYTDGYDFKRAIDTHLKDFNKEHFWSNRSGTYFNDKTFLPYEATEAQFKPLHEKIRARLPELAKRFNVDENALLSHFDNNAHRLGKRIYFATNPQSVAFWSGKQTEGDYLVQKQLDSLRRAHGNNIPPEMLGKLEAEQGPGIVAKLKDALLNQGTGGYYESYLAHKQYGKPEQTITVKNLDDLKSYISKIAPEQLANMKTMMQFSTPTRTLDSMTDFPIIRRLVQSSPGLKEMMGSFLPQADPSKDLSVHENILPNNIKTMDILDKATGRLKTRIHVADHAKAPFQFLGGKGYRLNNLKNIAAPLGILGAGGYMMYKALKPRDKTKKTIADSIPDSPEYNEKKAAVDPKTLALLAAVPTATALGLSGGAYLVDKLTHKKNYVPMPKELRQKFTQSENDQYDSDRALQDVKSGIGAHITNLGGTTAATLGSRIGSVPAVALGGAAGSTLAGNVGSAVSLAEADPDAVIPGISYIPGAEKMVRKHPYISGALAGGASLAAAPAATYYMAKKYYPYSTAQAFNSFKELSEMLKGINKFEGEKLLDKLKMRAKGLPLTTIVPAMGLGVAGLTGLGLYGAAKAKQVFNKELHDHHDKSKD